MCTIVPLIVLQVQSLLHFMITMKKTYQFLKFGFDFNFIARNISFFQPDFCKNGQIKRTLFMKWTCIEDNFGCPNIDCCKSSFCKTACILIILSLWLALFSFFFGLTVIQDFHEFLCKHEAYYQSDCLTTKIIKDSIYKPNLQWYMLVMVMIFHFDVLVKCV